jgi:tetratricopeptide (TPR) repeat protein
MNTSLSSTPESLTSLACQLCEEAKYSEAMATLKQALNIDSNYAPAWNYRGNVLSMMQCFAEALGAYEYAVTLRPDYHQAWFNKGLLFAQMGAYGNAIECYDQAISLERDPRYLHAKEDIFLKKKLIRV